MIRGGGSVVPFGVAPDGSRIDRLAFANGGALARILTWGATAQDFRPAGVALEPLRRPDAPNRSAYRSILSFPGEICRQRSVFAVWRAGA